MLIDEIKELAQKGEEKVRSIRRHLHAHPELSFQELETAAYIQGVLNRESIPWVQVGATGVVATIEGGLGSDAVVVLRADMDALPIEEENEVAYCSKVPGVMHACGHDVHMASLLGTALIVNNLRPKFRGTIRLLFQPAEEKLPGGALGVIGSELLQNPRPIAIIGQHVRPDLPCGTMALRSGAFMASMDELTIRVKGKGGHGAQPHHNIDPVSIATYVLVALQQLVSRMANPTTPTVLSFGGFHANGSFNVIPNEVLLEGTFRAMDEAWRRKAHQHLVRVAKGVAESMGGACEVVINCGYPHLVNEGKLTTELKRYAQTYLGAEQVREAELWMAAEDFAYYGTVSDACFYLLGVGNATKEISSSLHTPTFDVDEDALVLGAGLMAYLALRKLGNT